MVVSCANDEALAVYLEEQTQASSNHVVVIAWRLSAVMLSHCSRVWRKPQYTPPNTKCRLPGSHHV